MRTAAGVLLIIVAVLNLLASLGYLAGGAASTAMGAGMTEISTMVEQEGTELTAEDKKNIAILQDKVGGSGVGFLAFGVFLLVSVGILIAGAVFLFQNKKPQFIMIAAGMAILAEVIGTFITGFGVMKTIGLVAGILAILSAKAMGGGSAPEPADAE